MNTFFPIEEVEEMLEDIASKIPKEVFKDLNKGIALLPEAKLHPKSDPEEALYILGEYTFNRTGRQIVIYYGSFEKTMPNISKQRLYRRLQKTLHHEFVHHLEGLAGEYDLEVEDKVNLSRYQKRIQDRQIQKGASNASNVK